MDIRKIEYFLAVADELNFSEAAKKLHISHQALSKQIQQLEFELGAKVFERTTTKVVMTEVGKKMYDIFKPVVRKLNQGIDEIYAFVKYKKDTLKIGYFNGLPYNQVIHPVTEFLYMKLPQLLTCIV